MSSGRSRIIWICFYHDNFIIHGYWTVFITLIPQACFGYGYERLLFLCVPSAFIYPGYRNHFYYHIPTFLIPNGYFKVIFISIPNTPIFSGYSSSIFLYIPLFPFSCGYYEFLSVSIPSYSFWSHVCFILQASHTSKTSYYSDIWSFMSFANQISASLPFNLLQDS